ncbi:MAG: outer membrane protein assembly factor BamB [Pseudomonadota bacterium]
MIRLARFVPGALAMAVAVSGCGLFSSKDPRTLPAQLTTIKPTVNLKVTWHASVGKSEGFIFTPAMIDKRIYAIGANGQLTAFDAASGRQLWRVEAAKRVSGGVGAVNDRIVVGTQKGDLLAFDSNGKLLWKTELGAEILAPAIADAGTMIVRTADGRLLGLNVEDGKRKWNYQRVTPTLALRSSAPATVTRGAIFAGFPSGVVTALELTTGRVGWESTIAAPRGATELERIADVSSEPVTDGDQVCAAAYQGRVGCLEIASGKSVWSKDISSSAGIAIDDKYLYVSEESGAVQALDKKTGASVWRQKKLTNRRLGTPLAYGKVVLVGDGFGFIHALSKEDGSFVGRVATDGSALSSPPQAEDGMVLFQTARGGLYAVQVQPRNGD